MSSHEGKKSAIFSAGGVKLLPGSEEVVIDEPDDVKSVGNDLGVWEEASCNSAIGFREVHNDDSDLKFVKKPLERASEGKFGSAEKDIVDTVFGEVAEGGGISFFSGKEVLVDTEDSWAGIIFHLREFVLEEVLITAFDGGLTDLKLRGESFLTNAIPAFFEDLLSECFRGSFVRKNPRKAVIKIFTAGLAEVFTGSEVKDDFSGAETFMANPAIEGIFDS